MQRLKNIDILKFVGLFCIILAHVSPPSIIFQLRNFDVVLMIMISAYLYFERKNKMIDFKKYVCKRIKRLLIPTYLFLIFFFLCSLIINSNCFSIKVIISSFALHNGIGYVWVIRIYLITAVLLPISECFIKKRGLNKMLILNLGLFILYEVLCYLGVFELNIIFEDIAAYLIPCISIIVITYWLRNNIMNNKKIVLFSVVNLIIFGLLAIVIYKETGQIQNTNFAKYPFRLYYLSYAFGMIGFIILIIRNKKLINFLSNKFIEFVSKSSLWIYLWHILFIYIINFLSNDLNWITKYILIICGSCLVTYIQNRFIDKLEQTKINKEILKVFRG